MQKISITLDVSKIDKSKIVDKVYKDKEGNEIVQKIYKFDAVPVKEEKFVAEGDTWIMKKTHFMAEAQTKEEREAKKPTNYIGEGFRFDNKEPVVQVEEKPEPIIDPSDGRDLTPTEDIPF